MSLGDASIDPPRRGPGRPPKDASLVRPPVRDDRLAVRIAEIRGNAVSADDGTDVFFIDPRMIPDGWSYEWKAEEQMGMPDRSHMLSVARRGWEPVPQDRHPEILVRQKGMILMERPLEITRDAFERNQALAKTQVRTKEEQIGEATPSETRTRAADQSTFIKRSYENQPIPD